MQIPIVASCLFRHLFRHPSFVNWKTFIYSVCWCRISTPWGEQCTVVYTATNPAANAPTTNCWPCFNIWGSCYSGISPVWCSWTEVLYKSFFLYSCPLLILQLQNMKSIFCILQISVGLCYPTDNLVSGAVNLDTIMYCWLRIGWA